MTENLKTHRVLTYQELINVTSKNLEEPLIDARSYAPSIITKYAELDMLPYTGETILVRDTVAKKLSKVNAGLELQRLRLKVVYGYRHPQVQQTYFSKQKRAVQQANPSLTGDELDALTHQYVAVPTVAGHPTGGALDLTLVDSTGIELDMGTAIADFSLSEKIKTFAPGLTTQQRENRAVLHDAMVSEGFAPFYGEWWHFSYGDREWAVFYGQHQALYAPILLSGS